MFIDTTTLAATRIVRLADERLGARLTAAIFELSVDSSDLTSWTMAWRAVHTANYAIAHEDAQAAMACLVLIDQMKEAAEKSAVTLIGYDTAEWTSVHSERVRIANELEAARLALDTANELPEWERELADTDGGYAAERAAKVAAAEEQVDRLFRELSNLEVSNS